MGHNMPVDHAAMGHDMSSMGNDDNNNGQIDHAAMGHVMPKEPAVDHSKMDHSKMNMNMDMNSMDMTGHSMPMFFTNNLPANYLFQKLTLSTTTVTRTSASHAPALTANAIVRISEPSFATQPQPQILFSAFILKSSRPRHCPQQGLRLTETLTLLQPHTNPLTPILL